MKGIQLIVLIMISYSLFAQEGQEEKTHYVFPAFTTGTVLKSNGLTQEVKLNYNSLTEEMVFDNNGRKMAILDLELEVIDTVYIEARKFVVFNGKFHEYLKAGSRQLYVEHKCRVKDPTKPSAYGGSSESSTKEFLDRFISNGTIYEINLPGTYVADPYFYYWIEMDEELKRFTSLRQLRKIYKGQEAQFKTYVKEYDVKYNDLQRVRELVEYLESGLKS